MSTAEGELIPSPIWAGLPALQLNFGFNQWGNERILAKMAALSLDQLNMPEQTDHGSPFQLLLHALDTEWSWRIICQDAARTSLLWEVENLPDLDSVTRFWQDEHARMDAYVHGLKESDLDRDIDFGAIQNDQPKSAKLLHILMHILFHSHRHRAELATYLTKSGHSPGNMEYLDYVDQTGA